MFEQRTELARAAVLRAAGRPASSASSASAPSIYWGDWPNSNAPSPGSPPLTDAGVDHDALDTAVAQVHRDHVPVDADRLPFSMCATATLEAAPGIADAGGQSSVTAVQVWRRC